MYRFGSIVFLGISIFCFWDSQGSATLQYNYCSLAFPFDDPFFFSVIDGKFWTDAFIHRFASKCSVIMSKCLCMRAAFGES